MIESSLNTNVLPVCVNGYTSERMKFFIETVCNQLAGPTFNIAILLPTQEKVIEYYEFLKQIAV